MHVYFIIRTTIYSTNHEKFKLCSHLTDKKRSANRLAIDLSLSTSLANRVASRKSRCSKIGYALRGKHSMAELISCKASFSKIGNYELIKIAYLKRPR
jgi:hypothetical protein